MTRLLLLLLGTLGCCHAANWGVVVVGSKGYANYRHHADGCHAYHILKANGVPESNIILMMQDDVANAEENPFPGKLFNRPTEKGQPGVDVYQGCRPTYTGDNVTAELFLSVITGKRSEAVPKVLESSADDLVFINFVDHGGVGNVMLPNGPMLKNTELMSALKQMHASKMYKQLVFYMEACESGSMFAELPSGLNVFATTAANAKESSWGTYCPPLDEVDGKKMNTCLGDLYSVNWMQDSDLKASMASESLEQQFSKVKQETNKSHCQQFGDQSLANLPIHDFQADQAAVHRLTSSTGLPGPMPDSRKLDSAVDSRDAELLSKFYSYLRHGTPDQAEGLIREIRMREKAKQTFSRIAAVAVGKERAEQLMNQRHELLGTKEWSCHHQACDAVADACGQFTGFSLQFTAGIANMCKEGVTASQIAQAARKVCA